MTTTEKLKGYNSTDMGEFTKTIMEIQSEQRDFYRSGATKSYNFRKEQLKKLKKLIQQNENRIDEAIRNDMNRDKFSNNFVIGAALNEINYALETVISIRPPFICRRLKHWMKPKKENSPLLFLGNKVLLEQVPKGVVLILGPWNYPFLLLIAPLIGAIAGGNCAVVKPSEHAPHVSEILADLINNNFDPNYLYVQEGGSEQAKYLTELKDWDHIFFTGGTEIGRIVYQAAAKNLTPVTLELGGKTPTIVDKDVNVNLAAKRIAHMKFLNAGQTCMAPDYLFVHKDVHSEFVKKMKEYIIKFYGEDPSATGTFASIINDRQFDRLVPLIEAQGNVAIGGKHDKSQKFISPTIIDNVKPDSAIMKDEIFGPILPIMVYDTAQEVIDYIEDHPHPLALYVYTNNKDFRKQIFSNTTFGGAMVNDSVLYYLHENVPFGGVGESGIGNYLGKYSFLTFTQNRPIVYAGGIIDRFLEKTGIKFFRYPPSSGLKIRLLKLMQRTLRRFRI